MLKNLTSCLIFMLLLESAFAQDSITVKDAEYMKYRAELIVKRDLKDLLNNIASSENDANDIKTIITNSFSASRNKIFFSQTAIIEDDIDPNLNSKQNTRDQPVDKYLGDFDVLYTKTNSPSVIFSDIKVSNVKKGEGKFLYVKVYYNSFFRNTNRTIEKSYSINHRMASVRMSKENNKWVPLIDGITFFNPADTLNEVVNDIRLQGETVVNPAVNTAGPFVVDSVSFASNRQTLDAEIREQERKKAIEDDRMENQKYESLIEQGDQALANSDFTTAYARYNDAKALRPYDQLSQSRIKKAKNEEAASKISTDQYFEQTILKARLAAKNRDYENATRYYSQALSKKPEESSKYDAEKKEVTDKYRIISNLEEKYKAGVNYKDLIDEYDAAIKKNKTNSDLFVGRGKCYEKLNNYARALKDYSEAYKLDGDNLQALNLRGALYMSQNKNFEALTDYKTYLTISNANLEIYERISDLRMRINGNNFDEAVKDLTDGLQVNPKAANLYFKKGLLLALKKDYKGAEKDFSSVVQIDSNHTLAYYNRAKARLVLNNITNAALDFESARLKGLDSANIKTIESFANGFYQRAVSNFAKGEKDSAVALIDYAIAIDPYSSLYRYTRGEYYMNKNNPNEAIASFDQAIRLLNSYTDAYHKRGLSYFQLKNYNSAIDNFRKAIALNPKLYEALKGLGDSYYALQDFSNATISYEAFMTTMNSIKNAASTSTAEVYNSLGKSYLKLNDLEKALGAFKNALKKEPNYAEAYFNRGFTYYKKNELTDAIADLSKAVSLDDNHYEWSYYLARAFQDKKDFVNAANQFSATIKKDSLHKMPDAVYYSGYSNYQAQNFQAALSEYLKFQHLNLDSSIGSFDFEIANIYLQTNKYDSASFYFKKAYEKDSANGFAMYGIANTLNVQGKADEALLWYEKSFKTKQVSSSYVKKDKLIGTLRDDKRFKTLIKNYF